MYKRGFSLVELLVVISVISILIGILLPAVSRVKEATRATACASNLHQYAMAGRMYIVDNAGCFPSPHSLLHDDFSNPAKGPPQCQWHNARISFDGLLWTYLREKDVHLCPTFAKVAKIYGSQHFMHVASIPVVPQYSYSQNAYLGDGPYGVCKMETQVKRPSGVFYFSEENMWPIGGLSTAELNNNHLIVRYPPYRPRDYSDCFATYHNVLGTRSTKGSGNVAFLDGHVEPIRAKDQQDSGVFKVAWPKRVTPEMLG
jgi:prepilin-type N-terminal cleavage/methylation domain-containing protein/prepilin-type processing-associated H-X9-DG protein